jgi:hypothetical protein
MIDHEDKELKEILIYNIKYLWLLCRYTRGKAGDMPPILIYLTINYRDKSIDWMPLKLDEETPENIYVTSAAILQDDTVPVVLFLTDTYTQAKVPEKAYMMVSFTNSGLGPVVTSSLSSCRKMYSDGPVFTGNFSDDNNQEVIQDYLDTLEDEVTSDPIRLPTIGYSVSDIEEFEIDGVSSHIFSAYLENFSMNS